MLHVLFYGHDNTVFLRVLFTAVTTRYVTRILFDSRNSALAVTYASDIEIGQMLSNDYEIPVFTDEEALQLQDQMRKVWTRGGSIQLFKLLFQINDFIQQRS